MRPFDGPDPDELAAAQRRRQQVERERADQATDGRDAREHSRRAEQAGYLREKLEDQVAADDEVDG